MGERLDRLTVAARSALRQGQTTWSTAYLRSKEPRFGDVWSITQQIPGWFEEVNAASQFVVLEELRPRHIVEIGSYLGRSTVFYAKALEVLGIDELPSLDMFRSHLAAAGVADRVETIVATSHEAAASWSAPIDFLFIDGWHSYDAVLQDGHDWLPHLQPDGVALFDDANRYKDVSSAIDHLAADGTMHLYGDAFGQAFVGRQVSPPSSVRTVLNAYRPLTRHFPGHRKIR
jgi:Methyltransferase domain